MKDGTKLGRRELLTTAVAAGIVGGGLSTSERISLTAAAAQQARASLLVDENKKPGTTDWQLTYTRIDPATKWRCPWIEGYVSKSSIKAGETLELFVSTNPA